MQVMEEKKTIFDDFFNKNTPLVVTFAKRYQNRGLEFADNHRFSAGAEMGQTDQRGDLSDLVRHGILFMP